MAMTRWRPLTEVDEIFRDLGLMMQGSNGRDLATDVFQENNDIVVEMHVAGLEPDNVEVSVENHMVRITGTREETYEEEDRDYYSREILHGSFERIVPLPVSVNEDGASASLEDGILRIALPIKDGTEKRAIGLGKAQAKRSAPKKQAKKPAAKMAKKTASSSKKATKKAAPAKSSSRSGAKKASNAKSAAQRKDAKSARNKSHSTSAAKAGRSIQAKSTARKTKTASRSGAKKNARAKKNA